MFSGIAARCQLPDDAGVPSSESVTAGGELGAPWTCLAMGKGAVTVMVSRFARGGDNRKRLDYFL